jgi:hypothetical protein
MRRGLSDRFRMKLFERGGRPFTHLLSFLRVMPSSVIPELPHFP